MEPNMMVSHVKKATEVWENKDEEVCGILWFPDVHNKNCVSPRFPARGNNFWTVNLRKSSNQTHVWFLDLMLHSSLQPSERNRKTNQNFRYSLSSTLEKGTCQNHINVQVDILALKADEVPVIPLTLYNNFNTLKSIKIEIRSDAFSDEIESLCKRANKKFGEYVPSLFGSEKYADVILNVGDKCYSAHKNILASQSPIFGAMFDSIVPSVNGTNDVQLKDIEPQTVQDMLKFMYTHKPPKFNSYEQGIHLYKASQAYDVEHLKKISSFYLRHQALNESNALDLLLLADKYSDEDLKETALSFALDNAKCASDDQKCAAVVMQRPELFYYLLDFVRENGKNKD